MMKNLPVNNHPDLILDLFDKEIIQILKLQILKQQEISSFIAYKFIRFGNTIWIVPYTDI